MINPYEVTDLEPGIGAVDHEVPPPERPSTYRTSCALASIVIFFSLGYLFLSAMAQRNWLSAINWAALTLATIPWASRVDPLRNCLAGSISCYAGTWGGGGALIGYFALFQFRWFERIFNHQGAGELGMFFGTMLGFSVAATVTWYTLAHLGLSAPKEEADHFTE